MMSWLITPELKELFPLKCSRKPLKRQITPPKILPLPLNLLLQEINYETIL